MIYRYKNLIPKIDPSVFIAPGAVVLGDITIKKDSSIWFNVTARADVHFIKIGECTNIQDNSVLHVTNGKYPLNIGNRVTVGHNATLHGCTIKDNVLIGMNATVLDGAVINQNTLIAAGALVRENVEFPPGVLIAGFPAQVKRKLTEREILNITEYSNNYINYKNSYLKDGGFEIIRGD